MNTWTSRIVTLLVFGLAARTEVMAMSTEVCQAHFDGLMEIASAMDNREVIETRLQSAQLAYQQRLDRSGDVSADCRVWQFRSLSLVDGAVQSEASLAQLRDALSRIEALGVALDEHRAAFFRALVGHRRFDEARTYRLEHPTLDVEAIPVIADAEVDPPAAYRVEAGSGDRLIPLSFALDQVRLVAVVHPLCAFSKRALTAIAAAQPSLASDQAIYLTPVGQRLFLTDLREWNAAHASTEILLTNTAEEWPFIDQWATPAFYVLKHGQLQAKLIGWPDDTQLEKLRQLIDSVR